MLGFGVKDVGAWSKRCWGLEWLLWWSVKGSYKRKWGMVGCARVQVAGQEFQGGFAQAVKAARHGGRETAAFSM